MLGLAPDVAHHRPRPRHPARTTCAPARSSSCARCSTSPTTRSSWRSSTPAWAPSRRSSASRSAGGVLLGPDNGLLAPAVAMAGGARTVVSLENTEYHLPAPGPDVRRARHPRPRGRPPGRRRAASPSSGRRSTPPGWCPAWWPARDPRRRRDRRRGLVGRPLRQLPAQHRPRRARPAARAAGRPGRGAPRQRDPRRAWVHTYADAKPSELVLLVDSYGLLASPSTGSRRPPRSAARPAAASPWCPKAPRADTAARRAAPRSRSSSCSSSSSAPPPPSSSSTSGPSATATGYPCERRS